jgi:hypothetical protein
MRVPFERAPPPLVHPETAPISGRCREMDFRIPMFD